MPNYASYSIHLKGDDQKLREIVKYFETDSLKESGTYVRGAYLTHFQINPSEETNVMVDIENFQNNDDFIHTMVLEGECRWSAESSILKGYYQKPYTKEFKTKENNKNESQEIADNINSMLMFLADYKMKEKELLGVQKQIEVSFTILGNRKKMLEHALPEKFKKYINDLWERFLTSSRDVGDRAYMWSRYVDTFSVKELLEQEKFYLPVSLTFIAEHYNVEFEIISEEPMIGVEESYAFKEGQLLEN